MLSLSEIQWILSQHFLSRLYLESEYKNWNIHQCCFHKCTASMSVCLCGFMHSCIHLSLCTRPTIIHSTIHYSFIYRIFHLSIHPSIHPTNIHPSIHPSVHLVILYSIHLTLLPSKPSNHSPVIRLSLSASIYPSICPSISLASQSVPVTTIRWLGFISIAWSPHT